MKQNKTLALLMVLFVALISLPYLVPHLGALSLVAFVPLLCAERIATMVGKKRFFWWYFAAFLAFNLATTWWVCKATVGGGLFASFYSALFMSAIFAVFRVARKRFSGIVPYIFLAASWIAWERFNLTHAQLSWPWLILGNAFGRSVSLVQWYEITGALGGSLWVWLSNIAVFSLLVSLSDGRWWRWNTKARVAAIVSTVLVTLGPAIASEIRFATYEERSDAGTLDVVLAQSNFDPWHKLHYTPQSEQNAQVIGLFEKHLHSRENSDSLLLMLIPESFSSDIWLNDPEAAPTWRSFSALVASQANANLIFGASTHEAFRRASAPSPLARQMKDGTWYQSYNTAFITDGVTYSDHRNKCKLVVGAESTPYPKIFAPIDDMLGGLMGRCVPDRQARCFEIRGRGEDDRRLRTGVAICYESIYPELCKQYVDDGAQMLSVITNDGWWGDTPGYRQHFSYSRLRAIELRRDVARCANTGISGFINQRGDVVSQSGWWVPDVLESKVNLSSEKTFFATYGDIVGRVCTFVCLMLLALLIVKTITKK